MTNIVCTIMAAGKDEKFGYFLDVLYAGRFVRFPIDSDFVPYFAKRLFDTVTLSVDVQIISKELPPAGD